MGLELYQTEPLFREQIDLCSEHLKPHLGLDLRQVLYPSEDQAQLNQTVITQSALFVIEYALAKLWMAWGIVPEAMIGHSIGEYVAACLAGVFSLEEALSLVAARGQMMQQLPGGTMLAVPLAEKEVQPLLGKGLSLAAINTPSLCVVSGQTELVEALETQLSKQGVECRRLQTSHAFHSEMMAPILASFTERVAQINLSGPQIPYISNVTGNWISADEATDPSYWAKHLRQTVRFADGLQLLNNSKRILLEIGPGRTLSSFAKRHPAVEQVVLSSLRHPQDKQSDVAFLLNSLGKFWLAGGEVDWSGFYANERRYRLPLPTYPFERQRYWVDLPKKTSEVFKTSEVSQSLVKKPDIADWFYVPYWKPSVLPAVEQKDLGSWLIFEDRYGLGSQLVKKLEQQGQEIITVKVGSAFAKLTDQDYALNPQLSSDYEALVKELRNHMPQMIVHLWCVAQNACQTIEEVDKAQELGFDSLLFLAQALSKQNVTDEIQIAVVSNNMQAVTGEEALHPEKATVLGPVKVIGQEYPNLKCRSIDIQLSENDPKVIAQLQAELTSQSSDQVIAYRGEHRWVQTFEPVCLDKPIDGTPRLRERGVYLITGGLGGIGLTLAEYLAKTVRAKLILIGRSALPARDEWDDWLTSHDEHESVSRKIKKVQALEAQGAEVLVASADVANLQQMQEMMTRAEERFGVINGVIHGAGITGEKSFRAIEQTGKIDCDLQFQPKIHGTIVLEKVLRDKELDFCLLLSSLSSFLGGLGFVAYSAANIFMDIFAKTKSVPWMSVNWDGWQLTNNTKPSIFFGATLAELAMTQEEGINAFQRILSTFGQVNQLVVSTGDLQVRFEQWIKRERDDFQKAELSSRHSRPNLPIPYMAPRNKLEQTLANIWQTVLGIEPVGIYDDFFELGGDSLIAVQLIAKLREVVQVELSPETFLKAPTIASLADLITQTQSNTRIIQPESSLPSALVEIQIGNKLKPPLFLVHPAGGQVYVYRDLADCLGPNQPVYGLQQVDEEGKIAFNLNRVEDMATYYIEALRARQPEGPYFLGGSSFGGVIAFEMAQQLYAMGQKVALLAMIDAVCEGERLPRFEEYAVILAYLLNVGEGIAVSVNDIRQLSNEEQLKYFMAHSHQAKNLFPQTVLEQSHDFLRLFKLHIQIAANYKPGIYSGQIIYFRAKEQNTFTPQNPEQGWDKVVTGGIKVYDVSGNHITMNYQPHVKKIAEKLKAYLDNVSLNNDVWSKIATEMSQAKPDDDEVKDKTKLFYNSITQQLNSTEFGQHAIFLNYGYVADESPQYATIELAKHLINRNSKKLVLELIGDCDLTDCQILDTGCGRGGNISVMAEYFHAKEITGIDLSPNAIAFCKANYSYPHVQFFEGDAENLPFDNEQFDIVTNVESASNYPNIFAFFAQVYRVLKKGGYFLYTDIVPIERISEYLSALQGMGFLLEVDRDITHNVLLSCDDVANRHLATFGDAGKQSLSDFLAVPGSKVYTAMENRTLSYKIFRFKKPRHNLT